MMDAYTVRIAIRRHMCEWVQRRDGTRYCDHVRGYVAHILRENTPDDTPERTVCGMTLTPAFRLEELAWQFLGYADTRYVHDGNGKTLAEYGGRSLGHRWHVAAHTGCEHCWMNYRRRERASSS